MKIYALFTVPNGPKPATGWPVIVFNHGYIPPAEYRTTGRPYSGYVDAIARSGYIVFKSDYRGHDQSEGDASGGYGSPDYTIDVLNATVVAQALSRRRPEPDRHVGALDGGTHHPAFVGHDEGHQSGRDLGRGGGVVSRSDEPLAAAGAGLGADSRGAGATILWHNTAHPSRIRPSGCRFPRAAIWLTSRVRCSFTTARPTRACRLNSRKPCISRRRRPSCRSRSSTTSIPATTTISRRASIPPCSDRSHFSIKYVKNAAQPAAATTN